jgi:hypothetical protein
MMRFIFIFALGVSLGYWVGFKDARKHKYDVVARTVARVGGSTRAEVSGDMDKKMRGVDDDSDR